MSALELICTMRLNSRSLALTRGSQFGSSVRAIIKGCEVARNVFAAGDGSEEVVRLSMAPDPKNGFPRIVVACRDLEDVEIYSEGLGSWRQPHWEWFLEVIGILHEGMLTDLINLSGANESHASWAAKLTFRQEVLSTHESALLAALREPSSGNATISLDEHDQPGRLQSYAEIVLAPVDEMARLKAVINSYLSGW